MPSDLAVLPFPMPCDDARLLLGHLSHVLEFPRTDVSLCGPQERERNTRIVAPAPQARKTKLPSCCMYVRAVKFPVLQTSVVWLRCTRATGSLEYAHQNAGPGERQKTPAASCYYCLHSTSYHRHGRGNSLARIRRKKGTVREKEMYIPPRPPLQPSSLTKQPTEKTHSDSCGKRSWCPIRCACMVVCCTRWDGRTAGPADQSRESSS